MFALTLFAPGMLNDGDSFWHLAVGDWIIAHRAVPHTDPFSYTFAGAPWVSHEWLSEVLMAASFRAAGWSGVVVLTALAAALALFQLTHHLGRWLPAGPSLLLLLLAGSCIVSSARTATYPGPASLGRSDCWTVHRPERGTRTILAPAPGDMPMGQPVGGFILGLFLVVLLALQAVLAELSATLPEKVALETAFRDMGYAGPFLHRAVPRSGCWTLYRIGAGSTQAT